MEFTSAEASDDGGVQSDQSDFSWPGRKTSCCKARRQSKRWIWRIRNTQMGVLFNLWCWRKWLHSIIRCSAFQTRTSRSHTFFHLLIPAALTASTHPSPPLPSPPPAPSPPALPSPPPQPSSFISSIIIKCHNLLNRDGADTSRTVCQIKLTISISAATSAS